MKKSLAMLMLAAVAGFVPATAAYAAYDGTFRVRTASYNIRGKTTESDSQNNWDNRKSDLVKLVKNIAPDVAGFQEVKSEQYDYLRAQLSAYTFVGAMNTTASNAEASPVAFLASRFELLRSGTFWLSATPDAVGSVKWGNGIEDSGYPRICTWALLRDKTSGGIFCFACTHLDLNAGPRLAGMRLILSKLVAKYDALDVPVVLVGDMNALETEESMVEAAAVMQDSFLVSKTAPTGSWRTFNAFTWKPGEASNEYALANYTAAERSASESVLGGKRIDYIFSSPGTVVESFATRNDARPGKQYYPSDHYPVVAELAISCENNFYSGKVKVEIDRSIPHTAHGRYVLTSGAKLVDDRNLEFVLPKWVERAAVEDGEIVIYTRPEPMRLVFR